MNSRNSDEITALIPTCVRCLHRTGERAFRFREGVAEVLRQLTDVCLCPVGEPDLLVRTPDDERWADQAERKRYETLIEGFGGP